AARSAGAQSDAVQYKEEAAMLREQVGLLEGQRDAYAKAAKVRWSLVSPWHLTLRASSSPLVCPAAHPLAPIS
ncbi:MAG: hypothetical protein SGPRY_013625, partial [Prymnesium sp.]